MLTSVVLYRRAAETSGPPSVKTVARLLFFAHHAVAVAITCAGHHPFRETTACALAALHAGFTGRLRGVAGAVSGGRRAADGSGSGLRRAAAERWRIRLLHVDDNAQLMRNIAGGQHLFQCCELCGSGRQLPGVLDRDPVDGVLAPVRLVVGFPRFWSPCALRTVRAGRDGDQVLGIIEVVGVPFPLLG